MLMNCVCIVSGIKGNYYFRMLLSALYTYTLAMLNLGIGFTVDKVCRGCSTIFSNLLFVLLRFSLEKDELETGFQKKYKSLEEEYQGTLETITELKSSFKEEKELIMNEAKVQKVEIGDEFRKQKEMLEQFHEEELEKYKQKHLEELKSLENVLNSLRDEKKQLEGFFEKEKIEIGQQFAAEKAEIEQVYYPGVYHSLCV